VLSTTMMRYRHYLMIPCILLCGLAFTSANAHAAEPVIGSESVSGIGSASAQLTATINPEGTSSAYHFEYGPSNAYGSNTTVKNLGAGSESLNVSIEITDLAAGTEYHFRVVVATGEDGVEARGSDMTFTTLPQSIVGLPDDRAYEMVTPPDNENANVIHPNAYETSYKNGGEGSNRPSQVAPAGGEITYVTQPAGGGSGQTHNQQLAKRAPGGGWSQVNISAHGLYGSGYQGLSTNLSLGILSQNAAHSRELSSQLSPEAPDGYANLFIRNLTEPFTYEFHPVITSIPPNREADSSHSIGYGNFAEPIYAGSSADDEQVIFEANAALTVNAPEVPVETGNNNLYDDVDGHLTLVNVLPDGAPQGNANFGSPNSHQSFDHVLSEDGSRIFWTDSNTHSLYVRENATSDQARTVEMDTAAPGAPEAGGDGQFWSASSDGSRVFFTDERRLTENSTASGGEPDLYEYEFADESSAPGKLTDLSVDSHSGEHAGVKGVLGTSEDGSYVYFAAKGVLAENENGGGEKAQPQPCEAEHALCNLYVERDGQSPKFIATLSGNDGEAVEPYRSTNFLQDVGDGGHLGDWREGLASHTAQVAADGSALVFMSDRSLTGYPNEGLDEVYVYEMEGSRLFCASCSPSGAPPAAGDVGAAAFLPSADLEDETSIMQWISDDGSRVFFDSFEPLVARDVNGAQDVYEWERDGSGSCREQAGCIYLLSSGTSPDASWLIGSDAAGDEVFFTTRSQLVAADQNENYDLYDARIGGTQPLTEPMCAGTGCQSVPSAPPPFATPSSVTFNGAGNFPPSSVVTQTSKPKLKSRARSVSRARKLARALRACRGESKGKRRVCEVRARRRYGSRSAARGSAVEGRRDA
jgi:hypothetical protein